LIAGKGSVVGRANLSPPKHPPKRNKKKKKKTKTKTLTTRRRTRVFASKRERKKNGHFEKLNTARARSGGLNASRTYRPALVSEKEMQIIRAGGICRAG